MFLGIDKRAPTQYNDVGNHDNISGRFLCTMYYLGVDLGGTNIAAGLVGQDLRILRKGSVPTKAEDPHAIVADMATLCRRLADEEGIPLQEIAYVGIASPGIADREAGEMIYANNIPFRHFPLAGLLADALGVRRVFLENDANCAAWAEYKLGASKGCLHSIMLTLGTGVGGGIIINDRLLKGKSGAAGEMHFKMYPDKRRKCTCGSWDCFESYASGTALKWDAEEALNNPDVTTYDVIDGVKKGDSKMIEIFERWQRDIAIGIMGLANLFDPDCVVLSGSMAQFVDIKKIEDEVNKDIVTAPTSVRLATAGNYSGMIGAVMLGAKEVK